MFRAARHLFIALAIGGAGLGTAHQASAAIPAFPPVRFYGLAGGNLVQFLENSPGSIVSSVGVTGLVAGDTLHSIDVRPSTGQLFGLGVNSSPSPDTVRLYVIDPANGYATPVGPTPVTVDGNDTRYSIDFNPVVDRVRVVGSGDENLRLNPNNGVRADAPINDTNITPTTSNIGGIAYDRNVAPPTTPPTTKTTLFGIRATNGTLARIGGVDGVPSPNGGTTSDVGPLGVIPSSNVIGFDITPGNVAFAGVNVASTDGLYRLDLGSGAATFVGAIGDGTLAVRDIAVAEGPQAPAGVSSYVGVPSYRLLDTRETYKVAAGSAITVQVTNRGPIPATGVSAAILNVTVTQPDAPGYTTVWPSGLPMTNTSSVNVDDTGQTRAALVTVPVGSDGAVQVFSERGSHIIVDVVGYYTPAVDYDGRLSTVDPSRLLDTRTGVGQAGGVPAKPAAGSTVELGVLGRGGVPAGDVDAVVLNVTMTETTAPGFVTVFAGDQSQPLASNLNASSAGETIANLVIVPVGAGGTVKLFSEAGTQLIADVVGYYGPLNKATPFSGLFVPLTPDRILDTRIGFGGQQGVVGPGWSINAQVSGAAGVPSSGVLALAGTVTATESLASGFVTVYPTSNDLPLASTLNTTRAGQTIANSIILGLGTEGKITLFSETGTHLLTDVTGYFLS